MLTSIADHQILAQINLSLPSKEAGMNFENKLVPAP